MERYLNLNFYGYKVTIKTAWEELRERLRKDFSFFVDPNPTEQSQLALTITREDLLDKHYADKSFSYSTGKVSFFDESKFRYCLYPTGVKTRFNFSKNEAMVTGEELHSVHEVSYLLVLSRVGKGLDLLGLHRVHGAAFEYKGKTSLLAFSSGVGKTTLLNEVMKKEGVKLLSDDSPLIDSKGKLYAFPLRLGFEKELPFNLKDTPHYDLDRFHFGLKKLVSIEDLDYEISTSPGAGYIFTGERSKRRAVKKGMPFSHVSHLIRESLVGYGLPILFEYFWEPGFRDYWVKTRIVLLRTRALICFFLRNKKRRLILKEKSAGKEKPAFQEDKPDKNAKMLIDYLESS